MNIHTRFKFRKLNIALLSTLLAAQLGIPSAVFAQPAAQGEPAQAPLISKSLMGDPNIVIIFDNSGSMTAHAVPDSLDDFYRASTLHPTDGGFTHTDGWALNSAKMVIGTGANVGVAKLRSSMINKIYYDPAVTYEPWATPDPSAPNGLLPWIETTTEVPVYVNPGWVAPNGNVNTKVNLRINGEYNFTGNVRYCRTGLTDCANRNNEHFSAAVYFIYTHPEAYPAGGQVYPDALPRKDFIPSLSSANVNNYGNYRRVVILNNATLEQASTRKDCGDPIRTGVVSCTQAQEMKNFANWYAYYRSRTRTAIAALSHVFVKNFGSQYRFGWASLETTGGNIDGYLGGRYLKAGVRDFSGNHRTNFYNWLYRQETNSNFGTPTIPALGDVGQYYRYTGNQGPWGNNPDINDTSPQNPCRRSNTIMVTDGMWNTNSGGEGNLDNTLSTTITGVNGKSYTHTPARPFRDTVSNTMADRAIFYWGTDLRPDLPNILPDSPDNPAFWQHMVTHTVGFGVAGTLDPTPAVLQEITAGTRSWPAFNSSANSTDMGKIDDLWHTAVNSRGSYTSAASMNDLVKSLENIMTNLTSSTMTSPNSTASNNLLKSSTRIYSANYETGSWSGDIFSHRLGTDGAKGALEWKASTLLNESAADQRNIWIGSGAKENEPAKPKALVFKWGSLDTTLQGALGNENLLDYLRGKTVTGMRVRNSIVGDVVNSTPLYAKESSSLVYQRLPFEAMDLTTNPPNGNGYEKYVAEKKKRKGVLFVGANDGMLHAFGTDEGSSDLGKEIFAFIPNGVVSKLKNLAELEYNKAHKYYVDGPLSQTDVFFSDKCDRSNAPENCWRNVLLGSSGAGARSIFAIDITTSSNYSSDTDGGKAVLWDITPGTDEKFKDDLGFVMQPIEAGFIKSPSLTGWVAIVPNGVYSKSEKAYLFLLDIKTGKVLRKIATGTPKGNGLASVTVVRDKKTREVVAAYGGDLLGNLWYFDLQNFSSHPIFTTENQRPITMPPAVIENPNGGRMVIFGTGKFFDTVDGTQSVDESLYGIWHTLRNDNSGKYSTTLVPLSKLVKREFKKVTENSKTFYDLKDKRAVNWASEMGWTAPLKTMEDTSLRAIYKPNIIGSDVDFFVFSATSGDSGGAVPTTSCDAGSINGYQAKFNAFSGSLPGSKWNTNTDNVINNQDKYYAGRPVNSTGPGNTMTSDNLSHKDSVSGTAAVNCEPGQIKMARDGETLCVGADSTSTWKQLF